MAISRTDARSYFEIFGIVLNSSDDSLKLKCFNCGRPLKEVSTTILRCSANHSFSFHNAVMYHAEYMDLTADNFRVCDAPPY